MNNLAENIQHQERQSQTVKKTVQHRLRTKVTKGEKLIMAALLVGMAFVSFMIISNYAHLYAMERNITSLNHSINEQQEINESLELQVKELSSPDRIMYYAKEKLGMELKDENVRVIQN